MHPIAYITVSQADQSKPRMIHVKSKNTPLSDSSRGLLDEKNTSSNNNRTAFYYSILKIIYLLIYNKNISQINCYNCPVYLNIY